MTNSVQFYVGDLNPAAVLATLYNASVPRGTGFWDAAFGPAIMTIEDAQRLIDQEGREHHIVYGRPVHINLGSNNLSPFNFDSNNGGTGTAEKFIEQLRQTGQVNSPEQTAHRLKLLEQRSEHMENFPPALTKESSIVTHLIIFTSRSTLAQVYYEQRKRFQEAWSNTN